MESFFFTETMPVSSGGFCLKDHKTSFLQFNNPFNTTFQSHFMLSKAKISEPFCWHWFCWRAFVYKAVVTWSYLGPSLLVWLLFPIQAMPSCDVCSILIAVTPVLGWSGDMSQLSASNICSSVHLFNHLWMLRRKYKFNCLNMNQGKGSPVKLPADAQCILNDFTLKASSSVSRDHLWNAELWSSEWEKVM